MMPPIRSRIIGTGAYLPKRMVTNREIARRTGMSEEGILRRTGIRQRFWVSEGESSATLATLAARAALEAAQVPPDGIDAIILSTTSPDMGMVSTACLVQKELGIGKAPAFDIAASCSGFLYALSIADQMVRSGQMRTLLVIGSEVKSRFLDSTDAQTAILFGDGAGAVVLQAVTDGEAGHGLICVQLYTDGSRWDLIHLPAGGSRYPTSRESLGAGDHALKMRGGPLYRVATRTLKQAITRCLDMAGMKIQEIHHLILHQANLRLIKKLSEELTFPVERCITTVGSYGNTSSSSIAIALDTGVRSGKIRSGDWVLAAAFGGGLTWGTALLKW